MFDVIRCWYPGEKLGWVAVTISSNSKKDDSYTLEFVPENDESKSFTVVPIILVKIIASYLSYVMRQSAKDLTSLSYFNGPAVLHTIKVSYPQLNNTYSGIVLIAINPFQKVDQLYSQDIIQAYAGKRRGELEPHLFAIAEEAYSCMKVDGKNQTIIVIGEPV